MMRRLIDVMIATLLLTVGVAARALPDSAVPSADAIRKIHVERIDVFHQGVGIVVGVNSPLAPAMASMLAVRRPTGFPQFREIGLAWLISKPSDRELAWHNGGTGGYRSFVGYDARNRVGIVVLSNTSTGPGVDDIGLHLLDSHAPLLAAPKEHEQVSVNPKIFDGYTGQYQLAPGFILTITREGDQLFAQATGQPKFQIFPEAERDFFYKVVDAQITFTTDTTGRATSLTQHQNGADLPGKRVQ